MGWIRIRRLKENNPKRHDHHNSRTLRMTLVCFVPESIGVSIPRIFVLTKSISIHCELIRMATLLFSHGFYGIPGRSSRNSKPKPSLRMLNEAEFNQLEPDAALPQAPTCHPSFAMEGFFFRWTCSGVLGGETLMKASRAGKL